jgi:hypothetical protein
MKKIIQLSEILTNNGFQKEADEIYFLIKKSLLDTDSQVTIKNVLEQSFDVSKGRLKSQAIPAKIAAIPDKLGAFFQANGRGDVKIESNGAIRSLPKALAGGGARLAGSLHGIAFAHDLKISTPKTGEYTGIDKNRDIAQKDPEVLKIMGKFAEEYRVKWGGYFKMGKAHKIDGLSDFVYDLELHHMELYPEEHVQNIDPNIKIFMKSINMPFEDVSDTGKRRELYRKILDELQSNGSNKTVDKTEIEKIRSEKPGSLDSFKNKSDNSDKDSAEESAQQLTEKEEELGKILEEMKKDPASAPLYEKLFGKKDVSPQEIFDTGSLFEKVQKTPEYKEFFNSLFKK